MSGKARITADFATQAEVASRLGITKSRVAELRRQLIDLHVTKPDGTVVIMEFKTPRTTRKLKKTSEPGVVASRSKKK